MSKSQQLIRLVQDFPSFVAKHWYVIGKDQRRHRFALNPAQLKVYRLIVRDLLAGKPVRLLVLKYRQCGMSTFLCALLQHYAQYHAGATVMSIADKLKLPQIWLQRARQWYDETPESLQPHLGASNASEMWYDVIKSRYMIGSSEGKTPAVGTTPHWFHGSESALWLNPSEIERQTFQGIPTLSGTMIALESTGENVGDWFHRLWSDTDNDYTKIFLSWLIQDEYRLPANDIIEYNAAERELKRLGADDEQLAWRRFKIRNSESKDPLMFCNQYPSTPEEAFMSGGGAIFTAEQVVKAKHTVTLPTWKGEIYPKDNPEEFILEGSDGGSMSRWVEPDKRYTYVVGADCQWGTKDTADYDEAHVECLETGDMMACIHGRWDMPRWAAILASLGYYYNTAWLAPERNAQAAQGVVAVLRGLAGNNWSYPKIWVRSNQVELKGHKSKDYGWLTDAHTKPEMVAVTKELTEQERLDWRDPRAVSQMASFIRDKHGKMTAPDGAHDDALMSRMITANVAHRLRSSVELYTPASRQPLFGSIDYFDAMQAEKERNKSEF